MKYRYSYLSVSLLGLLGLTSCEETKEESTYEDWQARNEQYIDSIAAVARSNMGDAEGKWKIFKSYSQVGDGIEAMGSVEDYVYAQIQSVGAGTESPLFTDSVVVNYRGWNVAGEVFDQSYKGPFDESTASPSTFAVGGVVNGWVTALQEMHEGDIWKVYIPSDLGYGASNKSTSIPSYSALIFEMHLSKIKKVGH